MDRNRCLNELTAVIAERRLGHPLRVAIDGVDGVGKTTLADELAGSVRRTGREVIRASVDGFHNPRERRYVRGSDSPEGYFLDSFDYAALEAELLRPLGPDGDRRYRRAVFDHRVDSGVDPGVQEAGSDAVLLFDGIFLLRPELISHWDLTIFVDAPFEITVDRAVRRAASREGRPRDVREMYARRYVPGQRIYLSRCRPKERADLVVDNTELSSPDIRWNAA